MNTNFKVIGLTRLGIKPKATAPEADTLITRPSALLNTIFVKKKMCYHYRYESMHLLNIVQISVKIFLSNDSINLV